MMFSSISKRLTFTNFALILALVFAMTGGAFAAKHYLITSTSQISPKVLKALQGKNGAGGVPGVQGPAGSAGPAGVGTKGEKGEKGENGTPGKNGNAGATGPAGSTGPEGVCATSHCTLPSGATETGTWGASGLPGPYFKVLEKEVTSISFTIPLAESVTANVIRKEEGEGEPKANLPAGCKGTYQAPIAEAGNLCVFVDLHGEENVSSFAVENLETDTGMEAGKDGAVVLFGPETAKTTELAYGTWVVTAK